jgi:subtilisin family serine protease
MELKAEGELASVFGVSNAIPFDINGFRGFIFKGDDKTAEQVRQAKRGVNVVEDGQVTGGLSPVWGLDRINQRDLPLDNNASFGGATGEGVTVYVVDTGIYTEHPEFEGRASWGSNFVENEQSVDCNGHGTHVAGTVISKTFGVAKKANAVAVKVLGCDNFGSWSAMIRGIEWAVNDAQSKQLLNKAVINLSIQGERDDIVNQAVDAAVDAGLHLAVCAGNFAKDACTVSPASAEKPVTIAASDSQDALASFSDFGECVDLIGPGVDITSTWNIGQETNVLSGCSMATPHVAGTMALLLQNQTFTPAELKAKLIDLSTKDKITKLPASPPTPNRLLFFPVADSPPALSCLPAEEKHGQMLCDGQKSFVVCVHGAPFTFAVPVGTKCRQATPTTISLDFA